MKPFLRKEPGVLRPRIKVTSRTSSEITLGPTRINFISFVGIKFDGYLIEP